MTDRPLTLPAPAVRAVLDGRKTQHRVVIRPQPPLNGSIAPYLTAHIDWMGYDANRIPVGAIKCPAGVGDRLWVRETWRCNGWATDVATIFYSASENDGYTAMCEQYPVHGKIPVPVTGKWRSPTIMPRWASRITLAVTDVHAERLQDISEADAMAEGCPTTVDASVPRHVLGWFQTVWNTHHPRTPWDANPWVWVVGFERVTE